MGLRERIRHAIQEPVTGSAKLLDGLKDPAMETKLSIQISGWGRGLAAGLEELAIAIEQLQQQPTTVDTASPTTKPVPERAPEQAPQEEQEARADVTRADEEKLLEEAKRSREETAQARKETESTRS
jgi:hypothetical protein